MCSGRVDEHKRPDAGRWLCGGVGEAARAGEGEGGRGGEGGGGERKDGVITILGRVRVAPAVGYRSRPEFT